MTKVVEPPPIPEVIALLDTCPHKDCGKPLFRELDPEYGNCLTHGEVFRGVTPIKHAGKHPPKAQGFQL